MNSRSTQELKNVQQKEDQSRIELLSFPTLVEYLTIEVTEK